MVKVLGELKQGLIFVISAPAGTGKTTLVRMLQKEFSCVIESISYTTRAPRPGEVSGRDYHFIAVEEFEKRIRDQEFLEYATVFGNFYGTSKKFLEEQQKLGKHVLLVIDTQGALQLMGRLKACFIFIKPPSMEALKQRLHARKSESEIAMNERLSWAKKEMELSSKYDYLIVNDELLTAYDVLRSILIAEEHRIRSPK